MAANFCTGSLHNGRISGDVSLETITITSLHQKYKEFNLDEFAEAKQVLNEIAEMNKRPALPYGLEGENEKDMLK